MACLDDTLLLRFLDGALGPDEAASIDEHSSGCRPCRELVADLMMARPSPGPLPGPAWSPDPDQVDRRYVVLGLIGRGGMSRVYHALDRVTGDEVALKRGLALPSTARMEALAREFRTLATLSHPNVIRVLDHGFDPERRPSFTMELLSGARPVLRFAESSPPEARMDVLVQVLRALAYLHRRGVLHLDLKPGNILVVPGGPGGGSPVVKVLDFGLAAGASEPLGERAPAGTLPYVAPEVLSGGAPGEASDLYAVGVLAYQMLAGRHPFLGPGGPRERSPPPARAGRWWSSGTRSRACWRSGWPRARTGAMTGGSARRSPGCAASRGGSRARRRPTPSCTAAGWRFGARRGRRWPSSAAARPARRRWSPGTASDRRGTGWGA